MEEPSTHAGKRGISLHGLTVCSLLYLALPCLLFFSSWFTPWIAWPVNAGILLSLGWYALHPSTATIWNPGTKGWLALLLTFPACFWVFFKAGIAGYIYPLPDILIFREALFNNLIDAPWPLVLPNGAEMSYYLAGLLPPAMISRLTDNYTLQRLIAISWYSAGIWLAVILFLVRKQRLSILFILFILLMKDPAYLFINSFAGNGEVWGLISRFVPLPENSYPGTRNAMFSVFGSGQACNFLPYTMLATSLVINHRKQAIFMAPLCVTLLLPCSPIGAIALLPLAGILWLKVKGMQLKARITQIAIPLLISLLSAAYYFRAESATCFGQFGTLMGDWSYFIGSYFFISVLSALLFTLVLWPVLKGDKLLCCSLVCSILISWFYFGSTPESGVFGNNELWLKSHIVYHTHLIAALAFNWHKLKRLKYIYPICIAILTLKDCSGRNIPWTHTPKVADVWSGHLNHNHPSLYQKLPRCKETIIPGLLLPGGAAEQHFPGTILPKAPGCNYSRPAQPDGEHIKPF